MKQLLRHASRPVIECSTMAGAPFLARAAIRRSIHEKSKTAPACWQCQSRSLVRHIAPLSSPRQRIASLAILPSTPIRRLSTDHSRPNREGQLPPEPRHGPQPRLTPPTATPSLDANTSTDGTPTVHRVPDDKLPSHREGQRWDFSKKFGHIMEDLLAKVAVASQKVNNYTGTDYTGIESLRREIKEQEVLVKARHKQVAEAKEAYDAAHAQQASSQKEVVGLLERKHSWAAADLERYMSLIRSEHLNEQAVQAAKDRLSAAERALEGSRTRLEQRERAQYHEEQIWSDTIRRNSTWVTIGLMGVNISLLLASLIIIEPWRRKRLVREIRSAVEEKFTALPSQTATVGTVETIDSLVEAKSTKEPVGGQDQTLVIAGDIAENAQSTVEPAIIQDQDLQEIYQRRSVTELLVDHLHSLWLACRSQLSELLSERRVVLRKFDITMVGVSGAAVGGTVVGVIMALLRPV